MEKNIFNLQEKIDDALMYAVNKGVKAWNYTTGRTKKDLANSLLTVAPIFEGAGFINMNPVLGVLLAGCFLHSSHRDQKFNNKFEIIEEKAKEKGVLLPPEYYTLNKTQGYGFVVLAGVQTSLGYSTDNVGCYIVGIGHNLRALSNFVMCAEDLPPRKNVFVRAKNKIKEKLSEINWNIAPQPVQIPVRYRSIDDCFNKQI